MEVPKADQIVEERLRSWARGLLEQKGANKAPEGLLEEVDLLLEPLSKEDIIARLLSRELARLNLSNRQDLNDKGGRGDDGFRPKKDFKKGGYKKGGYKKDFGSGGHKKGGYKKNFKKGGYKKDGANSGFNDGGFSKGAMRADDFKPSGGGFNKGGSDQGGYRKSGFKKGGSKKGGFGGGGEGGYGKPKRKY